MDVGFYGKLPSHGDFLRRRSSEGFVRAWDAWLQEGIAASRSTLGDRWLDVYLTSPAWRFACAPGVAGPTAVAGVMAPSVDRVGRYFPVTVVAELPAGADVVSIAVDAAAFFEAAEQLVIETLETEHVDLEAFDARVARLADHLPDTSWSSPVDLETPAAAVLRDAQSAGWQVPIGSLDLLPSVYRQLLSTRLHELYSPVSVWWTGGSEAVDPSCLIDRGLPTPSRFAALLDGAWSRHQWQMTPARVAASVLEPLGALPAAAPFHMRSEAATDAGRLRSVNQDAFLERSDAGLWVVADGLGGHSDGDVASRMVCDALADVGPTPSLEELASEVAHRLQQVNEHLLRTASRSLLADTIGSTVVVLLIRGDRLAVLWAGDSRAYRWRAGTLEQLTRDHSAVAGGASRPESTAITRAVGADAALELDVVWGSVQPGDRYLLCSDGLTRTVSDERLTTALGAGGLPPTVATLLAESLAAGAPDNVTILIAEAVPDPGLVPSVV